VDQHPDPTAFTVHRAEVREGLDLAYLCEGVGGYPLLLVHGWPETKRIWWRNVRALAEAGFEVVVPDLRGFGDSGLAPDGFYDLAVHAQDLKRLVVDVLGHSRCAAAGGDLGGGVIQDMGLRFPGLIERQVLFNSVLPLLGDRYEQAGIATAGSPVVRMAADYFVRQGRDADGLAAELDTEARRRRYVADFYGHRFWASPGAFDAEAVDFMTEPFADPQRLRAGWGNYESAPGRGRYRRRRASSRSAMCQRLPSTVPTTTSSGPNSPRCARSPSPSWWDRSWYRAPVTSCSGNGPSCSTAR